MGSPASAFKLQGTVCGHPAILSWLCQAPMWQQGWNRSGPHSLELALLGRKKQTKNIKLEILLPQPESAPSWAGHSERCRVSLLAEITNRRTQPQDHVGGNGPVTAEELRQAQFISLQ